MTPEERKEMKWLAALIENENDSMKLAALLDEMTALIDGIRKRQASQKAKG
jgi:hypothetical protein